MSSGKRSKTRKSKSVKTNLVTERIAASFIRAGVILVFISALIFLAVFSPILKEESRYYFSKPKAPESKQIVLSEIAAAVDDSKIVPADESFSIIVPKIGANARIIQDVDPYNSSQYQQKLTLGVAHAKGSALPDQRGNTFLFAHSSDNFFNANRYNSVFYLLHKVELGDAFYIVKDKIVYKYEVEEKSLVNPEEVNYLTEVTKERKATLMTCWPPGTTINRLILVGKLVSVAKQ